MHNTMIIFKTSNTVIYIKNKYKYKGNQNIFMTKYGRIDKLFLDINEIYMGLPGKVFRIRKD